MGALGRLAVSLAVVPAHAVNLSFQGTIAFQLATIAPIVVTGSGTAVVNGSGPAGHLSSLSLPASPFALTNYVQPVTDPAAFPIAGVQATVHAAAGTFVGSGGAGFGGPMALLGVMKICLFGACGTPANAGNLNVPLSAVGQGGVSTVMAAVNLSVIGAPWTTGTASVGAVTMMGGVSPLSSTGAPSGTVTLVTPVVIFGGIENVPAFGVLTMHFVPEPATLVLLGGGIAALIARGHRRSR